MFQCEAADSWAHFLGQRVFVCGCFGKQQWPADYHHPLPEFGWHRVGQVVALAHWQVPQTAFGLLGLSYVAKACTGGEHPVEDGPCDGRAVFVRLGQEGSDTVSELEAALLPPRKQCRISQQGRQRCSPTAVGIVVRLIIHAPQRRPLSMTAIRNGFQDRSA
ncbi:hypothetical protein GCM10010264_28170 [Streptomyces globisporus]|nr:hypothetical protein GCM10010264_28170 [Streptomyces globisporus]